MTDKNKKMNLKKLHKSLATICLFATISLLFIALTCLTSQDKIISDNELVATLQSKDDQNVTNILFWIKYWNDPSE